MDGSGTESGGGLRRKRLKVPVDDAALRELELGDIVFLDGVIYTGREGLYQRILGDGIEPPVPLREISRRSVDARAKARRRCAREDARAKT